ncbi:hypothetical protein PMIN06_009520 [Paraphaeosphaeria minitans]
MARSGSPMACGSSRSDVEWPRTRSAPSITPESVDDSTLIVGKELSPESVLCSDSVWSDSVFLNGYVSSWDTRARRTQVEEALLWSSPSLTSVSSEQSLRSDTQLQQSDSAYGMQFEFDDLGPAIWELSQVSDTYSPSLFNPPCECAN